MSYLVSTSHYIDRYINRVVSTKQLYGNMTFVLYKMLLSKYLSTGLWMQKMWDGIWIISIEKWRYGTLFGCGICICDYLKLTMEKELEHVSLFEIILWVIWNITQGWLLVTLSKYDSFDVGFYWFCRLVVITGWGRKKVQSRRRNRIRTSVPEKPKRYKTTGLAVYTWQ